MQIHHNDIFHDTLASIKDAAVDYYSILFQPPDTTRAHLGPMGFKLLSEESASWLESPVTIEEIKDSVWSCDGDKSPGPDDFNFKFYRLAWEFIANDLMDLISEFFRTGVLPKGVNRAYISLVPKKTAYGVQGVSANQYDSFISRRQIIDGFMIANELILDLKKGF